MLQHDTEPRSVERIGPTVGPAPTPIGINQTESTENAAKRSAGLEQRESVVTDQDGRLAHSERTTHDVSAEHRQMLYKVSQVVWLLVGIVEVLIGLRVLLKLIGANPANEFGGFVYNFAGVFLAPFFGLTGSPASGGMVLEIPSLIAMLVYALIGWGIVKVVLPLFDQKTTRSSSTYDRHSS